MYTIYMIYNNFNDKKYIGVTKSSLKRRFQNGKGYLNNKTLNNDIITHGWVNFSYEILATANNKEDAGSLEHYYISLYETNKYGYNLHEGGFKNYKTHKRGFHPSIKTEFKKGEIHTPVKKVLCVETGIVYNSIEEATSYLVLGHHIGECCAGKRKTCGGYHWKFMEEGDD